MLELVEMEVRELLDLTYDFPGDDTTSYRKVLH